MYIGYIRNKKLASGSVSVKFYNLSSGGDILVYPSLYTDVILFLLMQFLGKESPFAERRRWFRDLYNGNYK